MSVTESANSSSRVMMKFPMFARGAMAYKIFVSRKLRPIRLAVILGLKIVTMPKVIPTKIKNPSHRNKWRLRCQCTEKKPFMSKIVRRSFMSMYIRTYCGEY